LLRIGKDSLDKENEVVDEEKEEQDVEAENQTPENPIGDCCGSLLCTKKHFGVGSMSAESGCVGEIKERNVRRVDFN
jgi:hypothetical protein